MQAFKIGTQGLFDTLQNHSKEEINQCQLEERTGGRNDCKEGLY